MAGGCLCSERIIRKGQDSASRRIERNSDATHYRIRDGRFIQHRANPESSARLKEFPEEAVMVDISAERSKGTINYRVVFYDCGGNSLNTCYF